MAGLALGARFALGGPSQTGATTSLKPGRPGATKSVSGGAVLGPGASFTRLLIVPGVGELKGRCDRSGRASTEFDVFRSVGATASVVVDYGGREPIASERPRVLAPNPGGPAGFQIWQIAPIGPIEQPVVTVWVAMGFHLPSRGCVISAHASSTVTSGVTP